MAINPVSLGLLQEGLCQFCQSHESNLIHHYLQLGGRTGFYSCQSCISNGKRAVEVFMKEKAYGDAKHLRGRFIRIQRSNGDIEDDWTLDDMIPEVISLLGENDEPIGDGVYCLKFHPKKQIYLSKCCLISEILSLNPV